MKHSREIEPLEALRAFVAKHPTQQAAAEALGVSPVYVSDLLNERRDFSDNMLAKLGLRRTVVEVKK